MATPGLKTLGVALLVFLVILPAATTPIAYAPPAVPAVTWSGLQRLTSTGNFDYSPNAIQTTDGKVWLFWTNAVMNLTGPPPIPDIQYKTWDWASWPSDGNLSSSGSSVITLVTNPAQDILPASAQLTNGTLFLSFSSDRTGNFDIYLKRYNPSTGWSVDMAITSDPGREETSTLVAASDGSLWVFWDRWNLANGNQNIYYKKYTSGVGWSTETQLTFDTYPVRSRQPDAFQMKDGRIWLTYSRIEDANLSKLYIYYRIYTGASWLTAVKFTTAGPDRHPSILQAADLTIWIFWNREISVPGNCYQEDLFYRSSTDNGANFSAEGRIMDDRPISDCNDDITPDDIDVSAVQLRDFRLWIFWSSDRDPQNWWDIYYTSSNAYPIHDVAVTNTVAAPVFLKLGGQVTVTVTVSNIGGYTDTFTVTVQATNATTVTVAAQSVTLAPWASTILTLTWNTGSVYPGRWRISTSIPAVPGESTNNLANNVFQDGTVRLIPPGDVNMDGTVNIQDMALLATAYESRPGDPNWNPNADLDNNLFINILDAAVVAFWYGTSG